MPRSLKEFSVKELLDIIAVVVSQLPYEKIEAIAEKLKKDRDIDPTSSLHSISGTPIAKVAIDHLVQAIKKNPVSANELAVMLLSAGYAFQKMRNNQSIELVWTGPKTPFVSPRRTEQALLEVINAAQRTLFIMSFVAYEIPTIMKALAEAAERDVEISMLMELSRDHGGSIDIDALGKMKKVLPAAYLYVWKEKGEGFDDGRVHAKTAVSDGNRCFITSANLTGFAMERNMELGVLVTGGDIPQLLENHLRSLIDTKTISSF